MSEPDLVVHVGLPRASAIVGPALRQLRPQLRARGVAYIDAAELAGLPHASAWGRGGAGRHEHAAAFAREVGALARTEQQRAGSRWRRQPVPAVVAGDQLLGPGEIGFGDAKQFRPFAAGALSQIVEAVSARNACVVIHTQRQDRLVELAYLRWLRAGQHGGIEEFFPALFEAVLDYRDLIGRLREAPHVCDVLVRPVELADAGAHAFINDLLGVVGLRDALDLYAIDAHASVHPLVYSSRGAALARAMNPLVDGGEELAVVQTFLTEHHAAQPEYGPPEILDPDARTRVLGCYADANRELFALYMPDLPADSYADDVATFDLGNVLGQPARNEPTVGRRLATAAAVRTTQAATTLKMNRRRAAPMVVLQRRGRRA